MASSPSKAAVAAAAAHVRFSQLSFDGSASNASVQDRVTEALILHARESSASFAPTHSHSPVAAGAVSAAAPSPPQPLSSSARQLSDSEGDEDDPPGSTYAALNALLSANHSTAHIEYKVGLTLHAAQQHEHSQPRL